METEIISIIIPVYNMERYLDRCVKSVLEQTYTNIEVLLIDDGSTDSSGALCDRWALKDSRIRVVHKENGGLSDARNTGIDASTGKYLSFIDSDDYVSDNMVELMYAALMTNQSDMSICNFSFVDEEGIPLTEMNQDSPIKNETISGFDAIQKLFVPKGWFYHLAWNKLYKKSLFSDIRYPTGKYAEDAFIGHRLFGKCNRVTCIGDICYCYTQRSGSIVHSKNSKYYLHDAESFLDRAIYCEELGLHRCAGMAYWKSAMFLPSIDSFGKDKPELQAEYDKTLHIFRRHYRMCKYCTLKERLQIIFVLFSPVLYRFVFRNPFRRRIKTSCIPSRWK